MALPLQSTACCHTRSTHIRMARCTSDQTAQLPMSSPAQLLLILFSLYPSNIQMAFVSFCLFKWIGSKHFFKS